MIAIIKNKCKNIVRRGDNIEASCGAAAYKRLHSAAVKNGGRLKIVKKHGLPFLLRPFRARWGIFAGILFLLPLIRLWADLFGM